MNPHSPADWLWVRQRVYTLTMRQISHLALEHFIDTHGLWESTPDAIVAALVDALGDKPEIKGSGTYECPIDTGKLHGPPEWAPRGEEK